MGACRRWFHLVYRVATSSTDCGFVREYSSVASNEINRINYVARRTSAGSDLSVILLFVAILLVLCNNNLLCRAYLLYAFRPTSGNKSSERLLQTNNYSVM